MHHEADELIERIHIAEIYDQFQGSFNFAPSQLMVKYLLYRWEKRKKSLPRTSNCSWMYNQFNQKCKIYLR